MCFYFGTVCGHERTHSYVHRLHQERQQQMLRYHQVHNTLYQSFSERVICTMQIIRTIGHYNTHIVGGTSKLSSYERRNQNLSCHNGRHSTHRLQIKRLVFFLYKFLYIDET